ncbi:excinuclease ABC subunit A [Donghicola mangrovi]|nr:excinuclease ABC subunit A [Donghicola mangrovi]
MKRTALILATAMAATLTAPMAFAAGNGCPPGLAKKDPACVPPGQAKKMYNHDRDDHDDRHDGTYRRGDHIDRYDRLTDAERYGLRDGSYVVSNGYVYRINSNTGEVLAVIGALQSLLN